MESIQPIPIEDKQLAESPTIQSLDQRLRLLTRLVTRVADKQAHQTEQIKHVLDNTNRIIALLMPSQES